MIGWREFFTDPKLQTLIELALQHNPDARIATLNIAAARAQYQIQRAELFPKISASATEEVEKFPAAVAPPRLRSGHATGAALRRRPAAPECSATSMSASASPRTNSICSAGFAA